MSSTKVISMAKLVAPSFQGDKFFTISTADGNTNGRYVTRAQKVFFKVRGEEKYCTISELSAQKISRVAGKRIVAR